jgi:DNA-binding CsgD family transcriptional regulator
VGRQPNLSRGVTDLMAGGRAALAGRSWAEARRIFEAAVALEETPEALEGLSWAAWWLNDADSMFDARERAYLSYRAAARPRGAARMATWLGTDSIDFRGDVAIAEGWFRRARRLLEDTGPSPERGWLCVHEAEKHVFANDTGRGRLLGEEATRLGRQLGDIDLEMTGLATVGLALVTEGSVGEGIACLDEAAAAALGGEFHELWSVVWCSCFMIYGCERVRDLERAAQWCRKVEEWSERMQVDFLNRTCRAHHAGVLVWRGTWPEAEEELTESASSLAQLRPPWAVEARVRLAELRRRQGRLDEAAKIFDDASDHPFALLGLGELCLDQDDPTGAAHRAEQYLREVPPTSATERAAGLELLARASAAQGSLPRAEAALEELAVIADRVATAPLRASAAFCRGAVASAAGARERARVAFEDAARLYQRSGAPFESGRARTALSRELAALGRQDDAVREATAAAQVLRRLGGAREADQAEALAGSLDTVSQSAPSPLTPREREVLRLVAQGRTNRGIAEALVLSEHTVNRHVTNILTKLETTSRSAAVAEALRLNLI